MDFGNVVKFFSKHITSFFAVVSIISILILYTYIEVAKYYDIELQHNVFVYALQSIIIALLVGISIILIEKSGLRYSVDEKFDTLSNKLDETTNAIQLKFEHGFSQVLNDPSEIENIKDINVDNVDWMNTFFRDPESNMAAILEVVERGTNVRLLMMHPKNVNFKTRGKYTSTDFENESDVVDSIKAYEDALQTSCTYINLYYNRYLEKKKTDKNIGNLEIRYYMDPAGIPILLLNSNGVNVAYSGFYLDSVSSKLPYIKWDETISGDPFIKNLQSYFEKKWYFARNDDVTSLLQAEAKK